MRSAMIASLLAGGLAVGGTTVWNSGVISSTTHSVPTACSSAAAGDVCSADDVIVGDDLTVAGAAAVTGVATFSGGVSLASPSFLLESIRFCGNGNDGATAHHIGPVPFDDTEADFVTGGAGCDGLDNATIGTVDDAWPGGLYTAFKPVALVCAGICTGATAANDTITVALYDDTAAVAGMACSFTFAGDATANQCTVTDTTPATVAAGSLLAIKVSGTDDVCDDAGDDFDCRLYVTF